MTYEIGFVLSLLFVALVLFVTEKLRMDLVALLVLAVLAVSGMVTTEQALEGFSNPAVVTVWAMFILSAGLSATGVADVIGRQVLRVAGDTEPRIIFTVMMASGVMSAFMNNVGVAALMLPVVMDIARRTGVSPSRLLMPMAYASLLGGLTTMIGTPPNLVASTALEQAGHAPFALFDFAPIGVPALIMGSLFVAFIGRHLLPKEVPEHFRESMQTAGSMLRFDYEMEKHQFQLLVADDSPLVGETLEKLGLGSILGLNVYAVKREGETLADIDGSFILRAGDMLFIHGGQSLGQGSRETDDLLNGLQSLEPCENVELGVMIEKEVGLAEVTLSPQSTLAGKKIAELNFRRRYGLQVQAIWRKGQVLSSGLRRETLEMGDAILLSGSTERIDDLIKDPDFLMLTHQKKSDSGVKSKSKAVVASCVMLGVVGLVLFGVLPIAVAAIAGVVVMVGMRCLHMDEAYRAIEWQSVFLIACMIPMGTAMQESGAAQWIAEGVAYAAEPFGAWGMVIGLYILTSVATTIVPTTALVLIMAPIAMGAAAKFNLPPHMIMMAVAMAASASFTSPISHPANVMVMGPGGYRFIDYVKMGVLLAIIVMVTVLPMIALHEW